jgi:hypothetical protein
MSGSSHSRILLEVARVIPGKREVFRAEEEAKSSWVVSVKLELDGGIFNAVREEREQELTASYAVAP